MKKYSLLQVVLLAALLGLAACSHEVTSNAPVKNPEQPSEYSVLENTVRASTDVNFSNTLKNQASDKLPSKLPNKSPVKFPEEFYQRSNACFRLELRTPYIGNEEIDGQIRRWEEALRNETVKDFTSVCAAQKISVADKSKDPIYYLDINYETSTTLGEVISVLLLPSTYTGGAHPMTDVITMNFNSKTGQRLGYSDIFGNTDGLLEFLSAHAYTVFRPSLGEVWDDNPDMAEGLDAQQELLSNFMLNPEGLTLIFPPYQIAPYSEGIQSCLVPLDKLLRFMPRPGIWQ
jgi:hypothetical protein